MDPEGLIVFSGSIGLGGTVGLGWGKLGGGVNVSINYEFHFDTDNMKFSHNFLGQFNALEKFYGAFIGGGVNAGGGVSNCPPSQEGWSVEESKVKSGGIGTGAVSAEGQLSYNYNGIGVTGGGGRFGKGYGAYYGEGTQLNIRYIH